MKKKCFLYSLLLLLVIGGLTLNGCNNIEDEQLGASRPLPNMLSDLSEPGAHLSWTLWESQSFSGSIMKIEFNHTECTHTSSNTITKYSYNFNYPIITLTSNKEDKEVITGTIVSDNFRADEATFKNAKNETVWMKMTRKK